jgi:phosphatidylglycerol:prolipoprotein diacylglycerol transferase
MKAFTVDPIIFSIPLSKIGLFDLQIRWYGMMYVIGFVITAYLLKRLQKENFFTLKVEKIDSMISTMLIGMFLGARLVYVFVYNWSYYSQNLGDLLAVWKGGLSFHGAILGLGLSGIYFAKKNGISFLETWDCATTAGSQGILWGRLGNFINGELYGRVTDSPFGMIFPGGGPYPRHPSQLYESFFEGLVMFCIIWYSRKKVSIYGLQTSIFIIGYGIFRFFIENFREPDSQLGYYFGGSTTMGQILCVLMVLVGISFYFLSVKKNVKIMRHSH